MNHEEYKELLAAAALDLLTEAEGAEFAAHANSCDECSRELRESRDAVALLAYAVAPTQPPAALRARILENIRQPSNILPMKGAREVDRHGADGHGETSPKILTLPLKAEGERRNFLGKRSAFAFGALAAALLLALIIPLAVLWKRNNELRTEIARQEQNLQTAQTELTRASARLRETQTGIADEGERLEQTPSAAPPASDATPLPPRDDEGTRAVRAPQRDDARQAEIARLSNRNNELQAQLREFSTRSNELQAEVARVSQDRGEAQTQLAALANQNAELQREIARLTSRSAELQTQVARFSTRSSELQEEIARLSKRNSDLQTELARRAAEPTRAAPDAARSVTLAGTKAARGARANLVYDPRTGSVTLDAYNLPPAPPGKAYQLWLIAGGKPVSGGVFTIDERGRATLRGQVSAGGRKPSRFAVTLEQAGGATKPTGDKYLTGSVR
ncbi:MAG: anti-sigma factor [Pyrinomonadaceae bacterium]|nr:anti-sigma factor [Pyrinomonadaceae bacterium]